VGTVAGSRQVRATVGALDGGSLATLWHVSSWGRLTLDLPAQGVRALALDGTALPVEVADGRPVVRVDGQRTALICPTTSPEALRAALTTAGLWTKPPEVIAVPAAAARRLRGQLALGSAVGVRDPGALGDVLVGTAPADGAHPNDWSAEFTVQVPHAGEWTLWARQRYPSGTDQSFALVPDGEKVTFDHSQVLGNCGQNHARWHWAGRGSGSTTVPPGERIALRLKQGPFTFRIHPRECGAEAEANPRLDVILLVDDPGVVPTDDLARQALGQAGRH
jgi:hypothetical protein